MHVLVAWQGSDSRIEIGLLVEYLDGAVFERRTTLDHQCGFAPTLAFFQERYYLCWSSPSPDNHLKIASSENGLDDYTEPITLNFQTLGSPSLSVSADGSHLYIACRNLESKDLFFLSTKDGVHFGYV